MINIQMLNENSSEQFLWILLILPKPSLVMKFQNKPKKQLFKVAYVREIYGPFENVSNVLIMRSRILQIEQFLYGWYLFIYLFLLFFFL